ncbi:hypothetical protein B0H10DRAFT_697043 [Mycena sp. CBHHK59/15]|nr:hypothetical protein B0H10DRAFT_697043 [Mycena sp. CBHHK59/15]
MASTISHASPQRQGHSTAPARRTPRMRSGRETVGEKVEHRGGRSVPGGACGARLVRPVVRGRLCRGARAGGGAEDPAYPTPPALGSSASRSRAHNSTSACGVSRGFGLSSSRAGGRLWMSGGLWCVVVVTEAAKDMSVRKRMETPNFSVIASFALAPQSSTIPYPPPPPPAATMRTGKGSGTVGLPRRDHGWVRLQARRAQRTVCLRREGAGDVGEVPRA